MLSQCCLLVTSRLVYCKNMEVTINSMIRSRWKIVYRVTVTRESLVIKELNMEGAGQNN